jgi:hypothetical protein
MPRRAARVSIWAFAPHLIQAPTFAVAIVAILLDETANVKMKLFADIDHGCCGRKRTSGVSPHLVQATCWSRRIAGEQDQSPPHGGELGPFDTSLTGFQKGRDEDDLPRPMVWMRHHDRYNDRRVVGLGQ